MENGISKKFRPPICFAACQNLGYRSREIDSRFIRVDESHLPASAIHVKSNLQPNRDFNSAQLFFYRSETFLFWSTRENQACATTLPESARRGRDLIHLRRLISTRFLYPLRILKSGVMMMCRRRRAVLFRIYGGVKNRILKNPRLSLIPSLLPCASLSLAIRTLSRSPLWMNAWGCHEW